jgi:hypothetical protein
MTNPVVTPCKFKVGDQVAMLTPDNGQWRASGPYRVKRIYRHFKAECFTIDKVNTSFGPNGRERYPDCPTRKCVPWAPQHAVEVSLREERERLIVVARSVSFENLSIETLRSIERDARKGLT